MGTTIVVCLTILLVTVTVCATYLMVCVNEGDRERGERESRWFGDRLDKAEKAEKDARQVIANLLDENKRLKNIIQKTRKE